MEKLFIRLQTIYHSAVHILSIGPQEVGTFITITRELRTLHHSRRLLPGIKRKGKREREREM